MPGTPPTTPNLGIPRYAITDPADFPAAYNAGVDRIDTYFKRHENFIATQEQSAVGFPGLMPTPDRLQLSVPANSFLHISFIAEIYEGAANTAQATLLVSASGGAVTVTGVAPAGNITYGYWGFLRTLDGGIGRLETPAGRAFRMDEIRVFAKDAGVYVIEANIGGSAPVVAKNRRLMVRVQ